MFQADGFMRAYGNVSIHELLHVSDTGNWFSVTGGRIYVDDFSIQKQTMTLIMYQ